MVPVNLTPAQAYEGLQKGMIDINTGNPGSIIVDKFGEVCSYFIEAPQGVGGGRDIVLVNKDAWNKLPQYIKDLWKELSPQAAAVSQKITASDDNQGIAAAQQLGVEFYKLAPEEWAKISSSFGSAWETWVTDALKQKNGAQVKEYIKACIDIRNSIIGEKWTIYTP